MIRIIKDTDTEIHLSADTIHMCYSANGNVHILFKKDLRDNDVKATTCYMYNKGNIFYISYSMDYQNHREDGPSIISYHENGALWSEIWEINGKRHKIDSPAHIWYSTKNIKLGEEWYINGLLHREDGPAQIWYTETGKIKSQKWYLDHVCVAKSESKFKQFILKNKEKYPSIYEKIIKEKSINIFD